MMPKRPRSASLGIISEGNWEASSHSMTCGAISDSANSRTVRRSCCCSSVKEKSTIASAGAAFFGYFQFSTGLDVARESTPNAFAIGEWLVLGLKLDVLRKNLAEHGEG